MYIVKVMLMLGAGVYQSYVVDSFDNRQQAEETASQMAYENGCHYYVVYEPIK